MPRCALEAVQADIVAPSSELPAKLLAIIKNPSRLSGKQELEKDTSSLEKIIILLRAITGNDFSHYKKNTLYHRIERRMNIHQISKISSYVRYLQENQIEVDILFKELLIGVTSFFRDSAVWEKMKEDVIPSLIAKLPNGHIMRAWVPGCSSGEEAYSLAIVFKEAMEKTKSDKNLSLQVFATDLEIDAIDNARKGLYTANIVADVSPSRLSRFFIKTDNGYRVGGKYGRW
jgi:two-component system CheB/CheR fusion protein